MVKINEKEPEFRNKFNKDNQVGFCELLSVESARNRQEIEFC